MNLRYCFAICYLLIPVTCFFYVCQVQMENRNFKSYTEQDLVNKGPTVYYVPREGGGGVQFLKRVNFGGSVLKIYKV